MFELIQLWYVPVRFAFVNKNFKISQNYQIKGVIRYKVAIMTKKYYVFIKYNWYRIWASIINCHLELFSELLYASTSQKKMTDSISLFSTKWAFTIIFNTLMLQNNVGTQYFMYLSYLKPHLFHFLDFWYFLKGRRPVNIFIQFSFPLPTAVWFIYILCKHFIVKMCSFFISVDNL